ncbi:SusC/RagA family TonB-linked outer membrane protein [Flavilitoribacter nigricans]|uniref:SusC/RagA family TonB-linked outer membrane protein n=1 Tax=Flavilitoribacter nigricans (strain ATCC 23147 / DSM 23189 / NBRC 102662 / NCIMB 1420 / SS-2) TaxID=1122177 RepID=A0A2D0N024_FLAN2|nr:TonB-dependent receptor [Flavilitoribacter nigricans]PHN01780.1 SusC/RagA family TonB-linked outer membrane protein [Flavilitoribacter nigricans DSM 23189 = NBRC 102662]
MKTILTFGRKWLLTLVGSILLLSLSAQTLRVSGMVQEDESGLPLIGVSVTVKGTTTGTVTDLDGRYALEAPEDGTLIFSYVGMQAQEVQINGQTTINLSMSEDAVGLSEVVVVGYGVQKKANLSGAVDQITPEQIQSRPISNLAQGLQGVSPNLNIDFNSGAPGQAAKINIRGLTSINGGEPLILIDGVPSDAIELNRLAPEDVESISVLKDASSAAIYGARAAFGVILITTKTGRQDGVFVSYNSNFSTGTSTILPDKITDPYIYSRMLETATDNTPWDYVNYSDETYAWAKERSENPNTPGVRINPNDATSWQYMGGRDWTDYFMTNYTNAQNHHLSISGKSDVTSYLLSGSFNRQNGVLTLADDYFDRYSLRGKVNFRVNDWISISNNTYLTGTQRENPSYFSLWDLYNFFPTDWDKNPDGTWANTAVGQTAAKLTDGGNSTRDYNSLQNTISAEFKLIGDHLKLNADYTIRQGNLDVNTYWTKYSVGFGPDDVREQGSNAALRRSIKDNYNVFNVYTTFNTNFGQDHALTVIGGFNQEYYRTERFDAYRDGIISASLPTIALATGTAEVDEAISDWAVRGVFYRLNYIFKDRYIVEFNGRYDGSSRFPQDKRFGFFPSASAAWRIDKEGFMQDQGLISLLKLRASYGSLGNQFVSNYGYIPTMSATDGLYIFGDQLPQRIQPPAIVSSNYTWEDVTSRNFGLEVGIKEDRLLATFDYYVRETKGMLTLGRDLPDVLGANEPLENAADLETKGWELGLTYRNSFDVGRKPLRFDAKFVLSDNRSFITRFDNPNLNLTQFYVGQEIGEIWGLESDGLFRSQDEIDQLDQSSIIPWGALTITEGWPKYVDQDGNGIIEKGNTVDDPKDLKVIGNMLPRFRYGLNLGFEWGGLDVNAFFQGIGKRDYYPQDYLYWGFYQQPYAGGYVHLMDYYRAADDSPTDMAKHSQAYIDAGLASANTDAQYPHLQAWLADRNLGERIDQAQGLAIPQSDYLLNAAYLRFKNLTIGYTLPNSLTSRINISRIRVFLSGENITEWSGVADYFDPEAISDSDIRIDPSLSVGRQNGSGYQYPFQRRYSVGINVDF